jgi:hypothetical protein
LISDFSYNGDICPSESDIDSLIGFVRMALFTVPAGGIGSITSIGVIEVNIFNAGLAPVVP